jgi:hypothetical protein
MSDPASADTPSTTGAANVRPLPIEFRAIPVGQSGSPKNGLHRLKDLGIPDSAITALLLGVTTLTVTPFVAGREFGPYTIPQVLPTSTFWPLALLLPIIWVLLLVPAFGSDRMVFRSLWCAILVVELFAIPLAVLSSPVVENQEFAVIVPLGQASQPLNVDLPFTQRLEVFATKLDGLPSGQGVFITACRGSDVCIKDQRSEGGSPVAGVLPQGAVSVNVFNFPNNAASVRAVITVKYVRRRYL